MSFPTRILFAPALRSLQFGRRGACAIPHPKKAYRGGEDAYFADPYGIGVADGVGGYANHGIDPAIYTRNVMKFGLEALQSDQSGKGLEALDVLNYGWIKAREARQPGGCPVTLVTLVDDTFASILNLGDCGVVMMRDKKLFYRSEAQQHSFNCPYQLPEDPPSKGERAKLEVREGDIFLCASDGVLDNVSVDDLVDHMRSVEAEGCTRVANDIGRHASRNGNDRTYESPFAKHAMSAGYRYMGGKLDDVTVLVARVTTSSGDSASVAVGEELCPSLITELLKIKS